MMGFYSTSVFGQECLATLSRDQVQINLPEWSGRQPHKEAYEGLEEMINFLTEVKDAIANAHPEGSEWLEDQSPAVTAPTAIQYEVKTIRYVRDDEIATLLNDGWEIIWQAVNSDNSEIIRFKRPVRSVISTERLTSEASKQRGDNPHVSCACGWRKDYFSVRDLTVFGDADLNQHDKVCPERERFDAEFARLKEILNA